MLTWDELGEPNGGSLVHDQIIRRNGVVIPFEPDRIADAMRRAFMAARGDLGGVALGLQPIFGRSNAHSPCQIARSHDLIGMGVWTRQHFLSLFKPRGWTGKVVAPKSAGFFSASKANLRNAP
ncbi:MAG: hypothetical protein JNK28_07545 [Burkholderiaceae bacterium]|nr:hypothetical protein [Burkholderiaceae bacterium]